jgi:large subunit ribosomal protein L21
VVEEHGRDGKIVVFKYKRRKNYRRTRGHRQHFTRLRVQEITGA